MNILKKKWVKKSFKVVAVLLICIILFTGANHFTQHYIAHIKPYFTPKYYDKIELTEQTDLKTIFLQTGIGEKTAEKMIKDGRFEEILEAQEDFFGFYDVECNPMIKWFTREERLKDESYSLYDLQPGDILVTLSTHTWGWRHGHSGLVYDEFSVIESIAIGVDSSKENIFYWKDYAGVAVLRVKDKTLEERKKVAEFAFENLTDRPYSLFAGFGFKKAPALDNLKHHCSYLPWYAWQHFGVDLDSDKGRIVTSYDILHSDKVEIVQLYGMDPREFI